MEFCSKCGTTNSDGARFCPSCGHALRNAGGNFRSNNGGYAYAAEPRRYQHGGRTRSSGGGSWSSPNYGNSEYYAFDPRDIADNRFLCILCYFSFLFVIPLVLRPNSPYSRFHCNQGLLLFVFSLLVGAIGKIPILGWPVNWLGGIFCLVCVILGVINTISGKAKHLPLFGEIKIF